MAVPARTVDSIDPFLSARPGTDAIFDATCGRLLNRRDRPLPMGWELSPELAVGFPRVTNHGKTYTFVVRKGFRFSTGARVTARDVAASVRRALRLKGSYRATGFMNVVGARAFAEGRANALPGVTVRGDRITLRLTTPQHDFRSLAGGLCVLPAGSSLDPEGLHAPVAAAGPYRILAYVPGRRIDLVRNRFYRGSRPHHVERIEVTLVDDDSRLVDAVERGIYDYAFTAPEVLQPHIARLIALHGVNRKRLFVRPGRGLELVVLNASRPLFHNNPQLRRAVNFAIDRSELLREYGAHYGVPADQYLLPHQHAFRDADLYPAHPNLKQARKLAKGHTRSGKAVFYTRDDPVGLAYGEIVRHDLAKIGIDVEVKAFPTSLTFELLPKRGEPFDIGWIRWTAAGPDDLTLHFLFDGRTLDQPGHGNWSHFDSPAINRRLDQVSRLTGRAFNRAYGQLDIDLARDYAPAVAVAYLNNFTLVSARTGCVITNPFFDLTAVCLRG
jgi:peptide/nickel transport system substrate-binding protein